MERPPLDCPGSLLPAYQSLPGEPVTCPFCGCEVPTVAPPPDDWPDPWRGAKAARIKVHH